MWHLLKPELGIGYTRLQPLLNQGAHRHWILRPVSGDPFWSHRWIEWWCAPDYHDKIQWWNEETLLKTYQKEGPSEFTRKTPKNPKNQNLHDFCTSAIWQTLSTCKGRFASNLAAFLRLGAKLGWQNFANDLHSNLFEILLLLPLLWPSNYPIHPGFSSSPWSVSLFTSLGSEHWTLSSKTRRSCRLQ